MTDLTRRDALRLLSAPLLLGSAGLASACAADPSAAVSAGAGGSGPSASAAPPPRETAGATAPANVPSSKTTPSAQDVAPPPPASARSSTTFAGEAGLLSALAAIPRKGVVTFGLGVQDGRTGRRFVHDPSGAFEMASTVKVDLLVGVLMRAHRQGRDLTARERAQAGAMIRASDNAAASAAFSANGRAAGMASLWAELGLRSMRPSGRWGLSTTNVEDRLRLLDLVVSGSPALPRERTAYVVELMTQVTGSQRWGIGVVARPGETLANKNGWLPRSTEGYRWIVSTTGRLSGPNTDLRLAVLSHGHASQSAGIRFVENALAAARAHLGV